MHGLDAAPVGVEAVAIGIGCRGADAASITPIVEIAVEVDEGGAALRSGDADVAPRRRMQDDRVGRRPVDSLDDVDFAASWPLATVRPEGGPHAAYGPGHVANVGDEEAIRVSPLRGQPHRFAAGAGRVQGGCVVDAQVHRIATDGGETSRFGNGFGDVVDEAVRRVRVVEEGESVKEVGGIIGVMLGRYRPKRIVVKASVGLKL